LLPWDLLGPAVRVFLLCCCGFGGRRGGLCFFSSIGGGSNMRSCGGSRFLYRSFGPAPAGLVLLLPLVLLSSGAGGSSGGC